MDAYVPDGLSLEAVYVQNLTRIEGLWQKLIQRQFGSSLDLWQIQKELLDLLLDLQKRTAELRKQKSRAREAIAEVSDARKGDRKDSLTSLQKELNAMEQHIEVLSHLHGIAKRLGDAFAWMLLGMQERRIMPLTENLRVPSVPEGAALRGVLAVADICAKGNVGFPLLHDVTNILRIGDITFVKPDASPLTVEVKTREVGRAENALQLTVEVYSADVDTAKERFFFLHERYSEGGENHGEGSAKRNRRAPSRPNSQLERQLRRMRRANQLQFAGDNQVIQLSDADTRILTTSINEAPQHWDVVRELVKDATASGYSSRAVDGAFLYVAARPVTPLRPYDLPGQDPHDFSCFDHLPSDVVNSCILFDERQRNSLWFGVSTDHLAGQVPPHILPLLLYPLPKEQVSDLLWGRLVIAVLVNLGKLVGAAEGLGLIAQLPRNETEFRRLFLPISKQIITRTGGTFVAELRNTSYYAAKILYEFLSLQGFANYLRGMTSALEDELDRAETVEAFGEK